MFGNGVKIGMALIIVIHKQILKESKSGNTVYVEVEVTFGIMSNVGLREEMDMNRERHMKTRDFVSFYPHHLQNPNDSAKNKK